MTRTKDEPKAQDISEIEDGIIKPKCFACNHKQNRHRKMMTTEDNRGEVALIQTKNFIGVCTNPRCYRYSNPENIPSWVIDNTAKDS